MSIVCLDYVFGKFYFHSASYIPVLQLSTLFLRSGKKRRLGFSNHIKRKHVSVNLVVGIKPLAIRKVICGCVADTLRYWRVDTGKNL